MIDALALQLFASVTVKVYVPALRTKIPVPVYGAVPPVAPTVMVVVEPLQSICGAVAETVSCGGSTMVTDVVAVQLFASVTVKLYVPPPRLNTPVPVYGAVPPDAVTVTVEVVPLQRIGVALDAALSAGGSVMVTDATAEQLFASVTIKVNVPAPLVKAPVPVYGAVPPVAATVTVDVPPLHRIGVALAVAMIEDAPIMVIVVVEEQLFASVTVKV